MKEIYKNFLKKYWIVIWLLVTSLSLVSVIVTQAAYNKTSTVKSVVARVGTVGKHFSSNYLQAGSDMVNVPMYVNAEDTEPGDYIRIFNYPYGNPGDPYYRQITYTLSMKLVYYNSNTDRYEAATAEIVGDRYITATLDGSTYTFGKDENGYSNLGDTFTPVTSALAGATASTDSMKLTYSTNQVSTLSSNTALPAQPKLYLEITAKPTPENTYLDLETIQARIDLKLNGTVIPVTWSGYFNETASSPSLLEGFNYVIAGVGSGSITLSWNSDYVELNQNFITELGLTPPAGSGRKSITFPVDSNTVSRYDTQFYWTGAQGTDITWNDMGTLKGSDANTNSSAYVICTFTEIT